MAIGTSHAMLTRDAVLDLDLIAGLRAAVPVPLVLHWSSGVADATLAAAVACGLTKINVSTRFNTAFTAEIRRVLSAAPALVDPREYVGPARSAVAPGGGPPYEDPSGHMTNPGKAGRAPRAERILGDN